MQGIVNIIEIFLWMRGQCALKCYSAWSTNKYFLTYLRLAPQNTSYRITLYESC